ncbi:SAM-dependent methyltransferase [Nonomuraea sediminis]|uniref:SAM-dependent methyltransferase n=1 Tax=Nonomuraea sediminis TaxID=2835864 RepID=UPI001BDD257E|nr:SAM-dependent methyltransferase [Nonomuraea sediminis]
METRGFDPNTPNVARLYDYYLGGKDHFPADREAAERLLRVAPEARAAARANRAFLGRAVRFLGRAGITQFLDIGTGLPTRENVHEMAPPGSRVVYVDRDPVVLVHARALLSGDGDTTIVPGDLRRPLEILHNPDVRQAIDFTRPVGVLLAAVMHFIAETEGPGRILATLRGALAPGSYVVMSHGTSDARPEAVRKCVEVYRSTTSPLALRSRGRIAQLLSGFDLVDPGLVWLPEWHPDDTTTVDFGPDTRTSGLLCAVGRKR